MKELCENCKFSKPTKDKSRQLACCRFPEMVKRGIFGWCGEYEAKPIIPPESTPEEKVIQAYARAARNIRKIRINRRSGIPVIHHWQWTITKKFPMPLSLKEELQGILK